MTDSTRRPDPSAGKQLIRTDGYYDVESQPETSSDTRTAVSVDGDHTAAGQRLAEAIARAVYTRTPDPRD